MRQGDRDDGDPQRVDRSTGHAARRWLVLGGAVLVLVAAAALAACSGPVRIGYDNADTLVVYTVDGYLDLDVRQSDFLRRRAQALLAWHRSSQLAEYASTLRRIQGQVAGGNVAAGDVLEFIRLLDDRMVAIGAQAAPDLAQLAATLKPSQVEHLEQKLAQQAGKAQREADRLGRDDGLDARVRKFASQAESWFGPLTPEQRDVVRASMAARPGAPRGWSDEVAQRGDDLLRLVRRIAVEQPQPQVATAWVRDYVVRLPAPAAPARRAFLEQNRRANADLIARLIATATPRQRAAIGQRLARYVDDCNALAIEHAGDRSG